MAIAHLEPRAQESLKDRNKNCRLIFYGACVLGRVVVCSWRSKFDILLRAGLSGEQNHFFGSHSDLDHNILVS